MTSIGYPRLLTQKSSPIDRSSVGRTEKYVEHTIVDRNHQADCVSEVKLHTKTFVPPPHALDTKDLVSRSLTPNVCCPVSTSSVTRMELELPQPAVGDDHPLV